MYIGAMKSRCVAWLLLIFLCCCNKNQPAPAGNNAFTFTTTYDSIINCTADSSYILYFNINVLSGSIDSNPVTYTISGLPANVTVFPTTQTVSLVKGGIFDFAIGNIPAGRDTASLVISSSVYGPQYHLLILNVLALTDYAPKLAGTYPGSYDYCTPADSLYNYTSIVNKVADTPYEIKITNIKNLGLGFIVTAWLSTKVTIPFQSVGSYQIWGSGTFTHDNPPYDTLYQMAIFDTLVSGTDTEHCIIHLQH
jgi:hypothetical protein